VSKSISTNFPKKYQLDHQFEKQLSSQVPVYGNFVKNLAQLVFSRYSGKTIYIFGHFKTILFLNFFENDIGRRI
jgi:hypothetical protein